MLHFCNTLGIKIEICNKQGIKIEIFITRCNFIIEIYVSLIRFHILVSLISKKSLIAHFRKVKSHDKV
jgi:hypothetical protein